MPQATSHPREEPKHPIATRNRRLGLAVQAVQRAAARAAGFTSQLTKPVRRSRLHGLLLEALEGPEAGRAAGGAAVPQPGEVSQAGGPRILVAEDLER